MIYFFSLTNFKTKNEKVAQGHFFKFIPQRLQNIPPKGDRSQMKASQKMSLKQAPNVGSKGSNKCPIEEKKCPGREGKSLR